MSQTYREYLEEVKSVKPRTLRVPLSDADVRHISELTGRHGLTVETLIANFITDLVDGTHSHDLDEKSYAEQWFEHSESGMAFDHSFFGFLVEHNALIDVIHAWEDVKATQKNIARVRENLEKGTIKSATGAIYTWKDCTFGDGTPCYKSQEEWEQENRDYIAQESASIEYRRTMIDQYWKEYLETEETARADRFNLEMAQIDAYWQTYQELLSGGMPGEK